MKLSNELNLTATYSMPILFICNQTLNSTVNFTSGETNREVLTPYIFINKIDPSGLMHVKFRRKMKIPDHPEWIQTQTTSINGKEYPNLKIEVLKGRYSDPSYLELNNWTLVEFKSY